MKHEKTKKIAKKIPKKYEETRHLLSLKLATDDLFRQGYDLHQSGDLESAAEFYIRSIENTPSPEAHTFLGRILYQYGEADGAIEEARLALKLDPDFGAAWNDLGLYSLEKHKYDDAEKYLEKAVNAKHIENREFPHFNLARFYLHKGMLKKASSELREALKINPGFTPANDFLNRIENQLH